MRSLFLKERHVRQLIDHGEMQLRNGCAFGKPGDVFYVREKWARVPRLTEAAGDDHGLPKAIPTGDGAGIAYAASWQGNPSGFRWRSSVTMPRRASRITVKLVAQRSERLQEIVSAEILAEGVRLLAKEDGSVMTRITGRYPPIHYFPNHKPPFTVDELLRAEFASVWDFEHGGESWAHNVEVYVCTFKRIERPA